MYEAVGSNTNIPSTLSSTPSIHTHRNPSKAHANTPQSCWKVSCTQDEYLAGLSYSPLLCQLYGINPGGTGNGTSSPVALNTTLAPMVISRAAWNIQAVVSVSAVAVHLVHVGCWVFFLLSGPCVVALRLLLFRRLSSIEVFCFASFVAFWRSGFAVVGGHPIRRSADPRLRPLPLPLPTATHVHHQLYLDLPPNPIPTHPRPFTTHTRLPPNVTSSSVAFHPKRQLHSAVPEAGPVLVPCGTRPRTPRTGRPPWSELD
jgi:hypothetical protein